MKPRRWRTVVGLGLGLVLGPGLGSVVPGCGVFDGDEGEPFVDRPYVLDCELYCSVLMRRCRGPAVQFASMQSCSEACATYPADAPANATHGNSLQCRFNFLVTMRPASPQAFCRTAGPMGGSICR